MELDIMIDEQTETPTYEDLPEYQPQNAPNVERDNNGRAYYPYIPDPKLVKAVNLAIQLKRPLLLEGEPGCGKTRLADSIAYQFTRKYLAGRKDKKDRQLWWNYYIWNVKSIGQARDGLYSFDGVARLRDAQLVGADPTSLENLLGDDFQKLRNRLQDKELTEYIKLGKLGEALKQQNVLRPIVLIDEIDKADSDFPNDLLAELDLLSFEITETNKTYPEVGAKIRPHPIVIITSNQERPLPEAFLRRCLYYYLGFPKTTELEKIIVSRFGSLDTVQQELVTETIDHFEQIRDLLANKPGSKQPGTSELLDFLTVLLSGEIPADDVDLEKLADNPHLLGIILKTQADQKLYREAYKLDKSEFR
jgi:MoxR-like ATPase